MPFDALIDAVHTWAQRQPDLLAAALVGSYARGAATSESDVDLILLTDAGATYARDTAWTGAFGDVRTVQLEFWDPLTTLRVWYRHDLEVEFNFAPPAWAAVPVDPGTARVVGDGMYIIWDPRDLLNRLQHAVSASGTGPTTE